MARKQRLEVQGGLYHLITRGVDRRDIFHSPEDHGKFLNLLAVQKAKLPFYLYAYCLMTNHLHLLVERRVDDIGRIMHRVLTGYTQYYNRRYRRSGHVLQGRHRAILCQSEPYLAQLVRYIHLNPVRAKMVRKAENYPFSSQRAYLGLEPAGIVDVDPVLRKFGVRKSVARERYAEFVRAGAKVGSQEHFYAANNILGSEEFVDETIHQIGEFDARAAALRRRSVAAHTEISTSALLRAVETVCGISAEDFCGPVKSSRCIRAKEALIVAGRTLGASTAVLARITGLSSATVSRRHDAALANSSEDLRELANQVIIEYGG
jgi:REP element-mobilizing transposase RayT